MSDLDQLIHPYQAVVESGRRCVYDAEELLFDLPGDADDNCVYSAVVGYHAGRANGIIIGKSNAQTEMRRALGITS